MKIPKKESFHFLSLWNRTVSRLMDKVMDGPSQPKKKAITFDGQSDGRPACASHGPTREEANPAPKNLIVLESLIGCVLT